MFESDSQVVCRFKGAIDLSIPENLRVQISNDNGNTMSAVFVVQVATEIPQFR